MRGQRVVVAAGLLVLLAAPQARAALFHRSRVSPSRHASGVSLRKRLHVNDLIAEPGTVELDWGALYSRTTSAFTAPAALKFTPAGNSLFRGRTEYSVAFDSVASAAGAGARSTRFSDHLTFAATSVLFDSPHFDIAVGPQVTAFPRNESGARLGAAAIAPLRRRRQQRRGRPGLDGGHFRQRHESRAGVWDLGAGYGRRLAPSGVLGRFTPHVNAVLERSTGFERTLAAFGGVEYKITEQVAIDTSGQDTDSRAALRTGSFCWA